MEKNIELQNRKKNYRTLLKPYKKSLIEISKDLFKISNRNFWSKVTISGSVIHTLVDVYITNNDFSRLITIEIPCANMYSESDLNKNDYNKLLFINRELQQIVTNLTNDLEKLLDKSIKKEVEDLKYSLVLNYDGKKFLYKGFIPSSKTISLNLQQYDMYNLIKNKNIIKKIEKKLKDDNIFIHKHRNLKVSFDYKNDNISNLTCLPLLSLTKQQFKKAILTKYNFVNIAFKYIYLLNSTKTSSGLLKILKIFPVINIISG